MNIRTNLLSPNTYSRPETALKEVLGIVMHWTANPKIGADGNRNYFEHRKYGKDGYGSSHFIIDQDGSILRVVPETEVAYHCGSSEKDPVSGKIYTDEKRKRYPKYANPNYCTIGIEMCPIDYEGNFTDDTIKSAIDLCAYLCKICGLKASDITTHHNLVGWKDCPRLWTNKPVLFDAFIASVDNKIKEGV